MISDLENIDFISTDEEKGIVYLTISDALKWDDEEHFSLLQKKTNVYLKFIRTNQIYEDYPSAKDKKIDIELVAKYNFTKEAREYLDKARILIAENYPNVNLSYRVV